MSKYILNPDGSITKTTFKEDGSVDKRSEVKEGKISEEKIYSNLDNKLIQ